ncbi:MAG: GTP-binding protein [Promethearchaeota archaeon]|nr:MAG: GTP-binding protein [Candidatus Lokiarchaeota archaeon]
MSENEKVVFQGKTENVQKIIVIGDPSVGKTSLLTNFSTEQFKTKYIPTVGVNIVKESLTLTDIEGEERDIVLMLWDIAGQ